MESAVIIKTEDLNTLLAKQQESTIEKLTQVKDELINHVVMQTVNEIYELLAPMLPATADLEYIARAEKIGKSLLYQEAGRPYLPDFGAERPGKGRRLCWPMAEYLAWRATPLSERRAKYKRIKSGVIEQPPKKRGRGRPRGSKNI